MASTVTWLNFDQEQQRRTELMMAAISEQGSIDELGLGVLRDLIAGALTPGLSVLHTRARYVFFLPKIYRDLTKTTPEEVVDEGRKREGDLVRALNGYYRDHGDEDGNGIIGRNRAESARQPASVAYWNFLRRLGLLQVEANSWQYCAMLADARRRQHVTRGFDDEETATQAMPQYWAEFPDSADAATSGFNLTGEEAEWLRVRFQAKRSDEADVEPLLSWFSRPENSTWITRVRYPWEHPHVPEMPAGTRHVIGLGRDLDVVMHGARILYNYRCALGRPDAGEQRDALIARYEGMYSTWMDERAQYWPDARDLAKLASWTMDRMARTGSGVSVSRLKLSLTFVERWYEIAMTGQNLLTDERAVGLVAKRERALKPGRARLDNSDLLRGWLGDTGIGRFSYRWGIASRYMDDIHAALGTEIVDA